MIQQHISLIKANWTQAKNEVIHHGRTEGRRYPFVTLTMAQSLDGYISAGKSMQTRLSAAASDQLTHAIRWWHSGILVGSNTLQVDNPRLTARGFSGSQSEQPQRLVLSSRLDFDSRLAMLSDAFPKPWFFCSNYADLKKIRDLERLGCKVSPIKSRDGQLDLNICLQEIFEAGVTELMVEGGSRVASSFLEQQLVNYLVLTIAPVLMGHPGAVPVHKSRTLQIMQIEQSQTYRFEQDTVVGGRVVYKSLDLASKSSKSLDLTFEENRLERKPSNMV